MPQYADTIPNFTTEVSRYVTTGNVCCKASPEEEAHVQESSVLRYEQVVGTVEEAKFPECRYTLDNNKQIRVVIIQRHHIQMQELGKSIAPGEPEVHRLVLILHAASLLKAFLPFDFANTSGQKPSTLCAHFTHRYLALDTLHCY